MSRKNGLIVTAIIAVVAVVVLVAVLVTTTSSSPTSAPDEPEPAPAARDAASASYLHRFDVGEASDNEALGGLSGIDNMGDGEPQWIAISDDKGEHGPLRAYLFDAPGQGPFTGESFAPAGELRLTRPDGSEYEEFIDAEEIRRLPDGGYLWTTEGGVDEGKVTPPQLIQSGANGREVRRIDLPAYHVPTADEKTGIYDNNGPEAMTLMESGTVAVTVEENALAQDGEKNSENQESTNRMTFFDLKTGEPTAELVVPVAAGRGATSLLADEHGTLFLLVRGFFKDIGPNGENRAEIYRLNTEGAEDVLGKEALDGSERAVETELVYDFAGQDTHPDNVEGMAWGPRTADGRRTLVVCSDDNFNDTQRTLLHTVALPE